MVLKEGFYCLRPVVGEDEGEKTIVKKSENELCRVSDSGASPPDLVPPTCLPLAFKSLTCAIIILTGHQMTTGYEVPYYPAWKTLFSYRS
jgi:hypothetical protein